MSTAQLQMRRLSQWSREMRTRPRHFDMARISENRCEALVERPS
jgi:hypothetical protein